MKTAINHILIDVAVVLVLTSCAGPRSTGLDLSIHAEAEADGGVRQEKLVEKPDLSDQVTLEEVIEYAKLSRWELVAASSEVQGARGRLVQAGRWPNPEIEIEVEDLPAVEQKWSDTADSITLTQSIPLTKSRTAERKAATSDLSAAKAAAKQKELEIVMEVKLAFYNVVYAQSAIELLEEIMSAAKAFEQSIRSQFEAGAVSRMEMLKVGIEVARVEDKMQSAQKDLAKAKKTLSAAIGSNAEQIGTCVGKLADADLPQEEKAVEAALSRSYEMAIARHGLDAAKFRLVQVKAERYPELEVGVGFERNFGIPESSLKFSLGMELPLFDSKRGEVLEKKAELASAKALLAGLGVSIEGTVRAALEEAALRLAKVKTYSEKLIPAAQEALKLSNAGYKEGKFSFLDVLDAQRTLSELGVEYLDAVKNLNDALLELEKLQACETDE